MLDTFVERHTRTVRGNQVLIGLRLLLATVAIAVLLMQEVTGLREGEGLRDLPFFLRPTGMVALIVCVLTVLYGLGAKRSIKEPRWAPKLALTQILMDVALISALVWHTGGTDSQFVVLYLFSICAAAFVMKWNAAIVAAALSTVLFSLVGMLYSLGYVPITYAVEFGASAAERARHMPVLGLIKCTLLPVCAFFLTAILSGILAKRMALASMLHHEILEGIGEGILVLDAERRVLYHNAEFLRICGVGSIPGNAKLQALFAASVDEQASGVLEDKFPRRIEISHHRPEGGIVPLAVRLIPLLDLDGTSLRGMIVAIDDITAEKKMEEYLKHRQRIETMGHLSATIAHEIRNPLASIRGAVQEIGRSVEIPEDKKVLLEIVLAESDRLDQIITDFLRFARMRTPKLELVNLKDTLDDVSLLLKTHPEGKNIELTVDGDSQPLMVDAEQIHQLMLNLGVNALQAMSGMPRGRIAFRLRQVRLHDAAELRGAESYKRVDRPGVLIELQDSGPGIPDEVSRKIFEPFFTTKPTGTGLGLAIVERIVHAHEGIVTVDSQIGTGTTFRVWIPADLTVNAGTSSLRPVVV